MNIVPYLDIPYEELDCWNLVRKIYLEEFGILLPERDEAVDRTEWRLIPLGEEQVGDLLVFRSAGLGFHTHVGVVVDARIRLMIHTEPGINSHLGRYTSILWKQRLKNIHRHQDT